KKSHVRWIINSFASKVRTPVLPRLRSLQAGVLSKQSHRQRFASESARRNLWTEWFGGSSELHLSGFDLAFLARLRKRGNYAGVVARADKTLDTSKCIFK